MGGPPSFVLPVSIALFVLCAAYRLVWRRRFGASGLEGQTVRLVGRVAGPGPAGAMVCRRSVDETAAFFELETANGRRHRVDAGGSHLVLYGGPVRVGDLVTVDGQHAALRVEAGLYREGELRTGLAALRISAGAWPALRVLDLVAGAAALAAIVAFVLIPPRAPVDPPTRSLACPPGTIAKGSPPPRDLFQWCEIARPVEGDQDGVKQGPWLSWWENGRKRQQGSFAWGRAHGAWTTWHPNGRLASLGSYAWGSLIGEHATWTASGVLLERGTYGASGQRDGEWRTFDERGRLVLLRRYANGRPHGEWLRWRESALESSLTFDHGIHHGPWRGFEPRMLVVRQGLVERGEYAQGDKSGLWEEWGANGRLVRACLYARGVRNGLCRAWHESSPPRARGSYVNGLPDGPWTWWHETGVLAGQGSYRQGEKQGEWRAWHWNGTLRRRGTYRDGLEEGWWAAWHENGEKRCQGRYQVGERAGTWRCFDDAGRSEALAVRALAAQVN